jgi:hypothetical protein
VNQRGPRTGSRDAEREEKTMSANRSLLERYVELYNAGDLDACMDLYAEDAVQAMPDGIFEGRSAIRERLARELAACPDAAYTVGSFVEQGGSFADEWTVVGTHTGPFRLPDGTQLPPTGKRMEIRGMELTRPYIVYRSRDTQLGSRAPRRGWERVP